jgi:hypothetical protein
MYYVFLTHYYHVYKITKRFKKIKTQQYLNTHIDIWKYKNKNKSGTVPEGFWVTETLAARGSTRRRRHPRNVGIWKRFFSSPLLCRRWRRDLQKQRIATAICFSFSFSFTGLFFFLFFSVLDLLLSTDLFFSFSFPFFPVSSGGKTQGAAGC